MGLKMHHGNMPMLDFRCTWTMPAMQRTVLNASPGLPFPYHACLLTSFEKIGLCQKIALGPLHHIAATSDNTRNKSVTCNDMGAKAHLEF